MENAKFRVVEFEESDVLTASGNTAPGTGSRVMHVQVTSSGDSATGIEINGLAGYMYEDGTWQVVGNFRYSNSNFTVAPGCYSFPSGLYTDWNGSASNISTDWADFYNSEDAIHWGYSDVYYASFGYTNPTPHSVHN